MRIAYWDIETHDLVAPFGPLLCASVLSLPDDKMRSFRMDTYIRSGKAEDMTDDRQLCIDLRDYLEEHHITAGYFSKGFDISHLRSRLVLHGERPLKEQLHLDPIWYFKGWRGLKFGSAKMKWVAEYLGLEPKPDVPAMVWLKARAGNRSAIREVVDRCEADVRITRAIAEHAADLGFVKNIGRY